MNPIEQLKSVLCDPTGKCCIVGSDEDRAIVDRALQALAEQPAQQEPTYSIEQLDKAYALGFSEGRKAAIERPAQQEPVAWTVAGDVKNWSMDFSKYQTQHYVRPVYALPPVQQEPVAWMHEVNNGGGYSSRGVDFHKTSIPFAKHTPLYTSPPAQRKPWVGLTDEDIKEAEWLLSAIKEHEAYTLQEQLLVEGVDVFARAIEAKLKEKNSD